MISYRAPSYRPAIASRPLPHRTVQHHQLGSLSSMTLGDWALLAGGVIVGGAGINMLIGQAYEKRINAVSILLGLVLAGVGVTLFVREGGKAISASA